MLPARFQVARDSGFVQMTQIFRHQHGEWLADHLFGGVAEDSLCRGIDDEYGAVGIDSDDRIRGGFGHRAIMLFTFRQCGSGSLTLD